MLGTSLNNDKREGFSTIRPFISVPLLFKEQASHSSTLKQTNKQADKHIPLFLEVFEFGNHSNISFKNLKSTFNLTVTLKQIFVSWLG